ncbi:MAG: DUF4340 domain-containing protein [Nitrosomonas sp.]|nr:DUF4340 domain-containing protein [Nitrosomonas sp.]MCW5607032.1 DUF4340 domain-containing protein [Nitrosomonas sp.]
MKKWIMVLGGLLAFQLVLVTVVNLSGDDYGAFRAEEKLLAFNVETIDRLKVESGDQYVTLEKQDGRWILPETWNYPADTDAVTRLLNTLSALNKGWPVATTSGAAERFKVAKDDFERKIAFLTGNQEQATLYIGTSPGFRKAHVRLNGDDHIFAVTLESWKVSAQADDWLKKDRLLINAPDIDRLAMADVVLTRSDMTLQPDDLSEQEKPDTAAISNLIHQIAGLQIQSILGIEDSEDYQLNKPVLEIDVTLKNGDVFNYRFSKPDAESDYYILKRSDLPYYFTVAEFSVDALREIGRSTLVREGDEDEAGDERMEYEE